MLSLKDLEALKERIDTDYANRMDREGDPTKRGWHNFNQRLNQIEAQGQERLDCVDRVIELARQYHLLEEIENAASVADLME